MADPLDIPVTPVEMDEELYRRVPEGRFQLMSDGTARVSARTFRDRRCRPSVDRANMCNHDPKYTQTFCFSEPESTAGVVGLIARAVREAGPVFLFKNQQAVASYTIEIQHVPERTPVYNPAHAEIYLDPSSESRGVCERLYESLAFLASDSWLIKPPGVA